MCRPTSRTDDQELLAGQAIAVGEKSITGPQLVSQRVDISYAHIANSGTARFTGENLVEMDAFLGAGRVDFRLQSSVTTQSPLTLQTEQVDNALTMGLGPRWWFFANFCHRRPADPPYRKSALISSRHLRARSADRHAGR